MHHPYNKECERYCDKNRQNHRAEFASGCSTLGGPYQFFLRPQIVILVGTYIYTVDSELPIQKLFTSQSFEKFIFTDVADYLVSLYSLFLPRMSKE